MKPNYLLIIVVILILLLMGAAIYYYYVRPQETPVPYLGDRVYNLAFVTEDGVNIAASYYPSSGLVSDQGVVLVHSQGQDRREWVDYAQKLQENGFEVITMDLRGYGLSEGNLGKFTEADYNKMEFDLREAFQYLEDLNENMKIGVVGSDLGANVALRTAAQDNRVMALVLLSPAKDYLGVTVAKKIKQYKNPLLIIASKEDEGPYADSQFILDKSKSGTKEFWELEGKSHGTKMLEKQEDLGDRIIEWLKNNLI